MCNFTARQWRGQAIQLKCDHNNAYEWMDYDLPTPALSFDKDGKACLTWYIDGYFATRKGREYLNDIGLRLARTLNASLVPNHRTVKPVQNIAKLSEFKGLDSIKDASWRKHLDVLAFLDQSDTRDQRINVDRLFDVMRFAAYDLVKAHGKEALTVEYIEDIGMQSKDSFNKARSDVKGKAKAIFAWVIENYTISGRYADMTKEEKARHVKAWRDLQKLKKIQRGEEIMSRTDNAKKQAEAIAKETEAKVRGAIASLQFLQEKITASAVAKQAGVSRPTATKYLKEMGLR